jgi:hypothetical protein
MNADISRETACSSVAFCEDGIVASAVDWASVKREIQVISKFSVVITLF